MILTKRPRTSSPVRARRTTLRLEALEDRLVLSPTPIADTTQFPFRAIARIEAHFPSQPSNEYFEGTGTLIDSSHVLTAGHVIYDASEGGWADSVHVIPAQNAASDLPYGDAYATMLRTFTSFVQVEQQGSYDEHGDLGLITLDRQVGTSTGWMALGTTDAAYFNNISLNTAGYPAEQGYSGYQMYSQYAPLSGVTSDGALFDWNYSAITSIPGQSGSPLWDYNPSTGQRTVYGVLVSGDNQNQIGYGVRLTQPLLQDVANWVGQDTPPTATQSAPHVPFTATLSDPATQAVLTASPANASGGTGFGIGMVDPGTATWYLRNETSTGGADAGSFGYGVRGWIPVVGDWNGDGVDSVGMFDPSTATWYLRNENSAGGADAGVFQFGLPGWIPVVGDWNGDGVDSVGMFDPSSATWYLRNENSTGGADAGVFQYGLAGWKPVVGSWDGGRASHVGVFDPSSATWYLRNENTPGGADAGQFAYGAPGWQPITGDWNGGSMTTVGVIDPNSATWYLRSANSAGPPTVASFAYGVAGWLGVGGFWEGMDGSGGSPSATPPAHGNQDPATALMFDDANFDLSRTSANAAHKNPIGMVGPGVRPLSDELVTGLLAGRPKGRPQSGDGSGVLS